MLEEAGIYSAVSGVTNNQSEAINSVLKRLQNRREAPIDMVVLSLYHLQTFYYNEAQRGLAGIYNLQE